MSEKVIPNSIGVGVVIVAKSYNQARNFAGSIGLKRFSFPAGWQSLSGLSNHLIVILEGWRDRDDFTEIKNELNSCQRFNTILANYEVTPVSW